MHVFRPPLHRPGNGIGSTLPAEGLRAGSSSTRKEDWGSKGTNVSVKDERKPKWSRGCSTKLHCQAGYLKLPRPQVRARGWHKETSITRINDSEWRSTTRSFLPPTSATGCRHKELSGNLERSQGTGTFVFHFKLLPQTFGQSEN